MILIIDLNFHLREVFFSKSPCTQFVSCLNRKDWNYVDTVYQKNSGFVTHRISFNKIASGLGWLQLLFDKNTHGVTWEITIDHWNCGLMRMSVPKKTASVSDFIFATHSF